MNADSAGVIAFNRVAPAGRELEYMNEAVACGQIAGNGSFTKRCEALLEEVMGASRVMLTTSCTHALEMSAMLLDVGPGDEVIMPSFTFVSTANAFMLRGARPVFADVHPDTLNLDERHVEALVTERTRCVVPVHYGGVACALEALEHLARRHDLVIVEDNAHGLFGTYRDRPLGTFGALAAQSFHATKNVTCGEGGALIINSPEYIERAEILREKGTDRSKFFRGEIDKYTWVDLGSSYPPSEILAAFLLGQLEARESIQQQRKHIWNRYRTELEEWAAEQGVVMPAVPEGCEHPAHLFFLVMPDARAQEALLGHLRARGVLAVFHYQPLHLSTMGRSLGGQSGQCPVTESVSERLVRLPLFHSLTDAEQTHVVESVRSFVR